MKNLYLMVATLLFSSLSIAQNTGKQPQENEAPPSTESTSFTGYSGTGANINVVYQRCNWTIDPTVSKNISGTVTIYFTTISPNVSVINFDLRKSVFNVTPPVVTQRSVTCTSSFPASGNVNILNITLTSTIVTTGTLDSVSITYSGTPPAVNGQEEGFQRKQDGLGNWYIYTLSESYEDRDWWPCKADMQDKIDSIDINVTVPNTYWVATAGILTDSAINGANRTFKYKHRHPIASYLVALGIAKYNRHHRGTVNINGINVPVVYYTFPDMTGATLTTALDRMDISKTEMVEFSNKYGPYPFANEKHGYYQFGWGGGMEHQTFSAMSAGSMASWSVIAHELAHQWWGDKVTFSTWNHLWLAEGFAKYSEVLAAELIPAIGVTPTSHLSAIKTTARATNTTPVLLSAASIATSNTIWTTNNDNALYQRGAMIVSMLRTMMGDAKFFQACRNYLNDPLLSFKSAVTADLQRNMENQLGLNLTPFFTAWVNGTGRTNYTGQYYITGQKIQFNLNQTREPSANPFMPMPVAIKVSNAAGTRDTTVVIYHYSTTQLGFAGDGIGPAGANCITFNIPFTPASAVIDPDHKTMATGTLTAIGSPLDANVLDFTAKKNGAFNKIELSIASSDSAQRIVLYKGTNGTDFIEAGLMTKVMNKGGITQYRYDDIDPEPNSFYRAKIYTFNTSQLTQIVKVLRTVSENMVIAPNPASATVSIEFKNDLKENLTVRINGIDGKPMIESNTTNNFIHYDVSNLTAGVYIVQILKEGRQLETRKFIVRH